MNPLLELGSATGISYTKRKKGVFNVPLPNNESIPMPNKDLYKKNKAKINGRKR